MDGVVKLVAQAGKVDPDRWLPDDDDDDVVGVLTDIFQDSPDSKRCPKIIRPLFFFK